MGSDPQTYLQFMHEAEHKDCRERIAALEAQNDAGKNELPVIRIRGECPMHHPLDDRYGPLVCKQCADERIAALETKIEQIRFNTICLYCGHEEKHDGTGDGVRAVMAPHILTCTNHPINRLIEAERERDEARRELAEERARLDWYVLHQFGYDAYEVFCRYYRLDRPVPDPLTSDEWRAAIDEARSRS